MAPRSTTSNDPRDAQDSDSRANGATRSRRSVLSAAATTAAAASLPLATGTGTVAGQSDTDAEHRVVSYYTGWSRYDRDYQPADVPLEKITDLNYAFLTVEEDGTVTYADEWGDQENLSAFRDLMDDHPDTRFHLSIGGWSDSTYFSNAAATRENRERFASTAIEILQRYDFDGIDLDWEYPGGGGQQGNVTREDDPENLVLLLEELRDQLDRIEGGPAADGVEGDSYSITMAASASPSTASALPIAEIEPYVEYVTVMTYDYAGSWSDRTGHNAPLHGDGPCVADSMAWWAEQPIPREKVLLGVPFYGRAFDGVEVVADGSAGDGPQEADGLGHSFDGSEMVLYGDLDGEYPTDGSYVRYWDEAAQVPYRFSLEDGTFVSYDDAESIAAKTQFALEEGFGGVMAWEQPGDPDGELLDAVHEQFDAGDDRGDEDDTDEPTCDGVAVEGGSTEIDGRTVCDVDGDGLYRDVTGDGSVGQTDVVEFFQVQHREGWKRAGLFDFSGEGSVGHGDVVALFEDVATS